MIKLVIFDLDGVIIDLKECHFESLNSALHSIDPHYVISLDDHYKFYDGLPTRQKLMMLSRYKGLPIDRHEVIMEKKQEFTLKFIYENVELSKNVIETLQHLKESNKRICVASNSVSNTIYSVLTKLKILHLVDQVFSNQDVKHPKPNPEVYFRAISHFGVIPKETLIVEDSPFGLEAAHHSGANVFRVVNSKDVTVDNIKSQLDKYSSRVTNYKWKDDKMNVLIPMAGAGSRFESAGYKLPKPLIEVKGRPMIERVVDNINLNAKYTFVVQEKHELEHKVSETLKRISSNCNVVQTDGLTEGAACTALLAEKFIDNEEPLLIANSDQFVEWNSVNFYYQVLSQQNSDGCILTFKSTHPKWSFAKVNDDGFVTQVAEKNPISDVATVGIYYWRKGSDFVKYAKQMIQKNVRVNNEFYIAPVFNQAIEDGKKITTYEVERMWGLGTPEDLKIFIESYM